MKKSEEINRIASKDVNTIIAKYSIIAAISYMVFFGIMKLAGYAYVTELRYFNFVILALLGAMALNEARTKGEGRIYYLQGFGLILITGIFSFAIFAVEILLYSTYDKFFNNTIAALYPGAMMLGIYSAPVIIAAEGAAYSVIVALCLMQYYKRYAVGKMRRRFEYKDPTEQHAISSLKN